MFKKTIASMVVWCVPLIAVAQDQDSKLSIHGYLSQAYGDSEDRETQGLPTDGTFDYRTAALLFRYDMSPQDHFVLQLDHERTGVSEFQQFRDDIEVDWLFFQHDFGDEHLVRVGKIPVPFGLFNELRDVGTLLPFYRPPASLYSEEALTSETIDGVVLAFGSSEARSWNVESEFYFGEWSSRDLFGGETKAKDVTGVQLWLNSAAGLRFGLNVRSYDNQVELVETDRWDEILASFEADFDRFVIRGEYDDIDFPIGSYESYYAQLGIRLGSGVWLNLQSETAELTLSLPTSFGPFGPVFETLVFPVIDDDVAIGLSYAFRPDVVLKLERHQVEGVTFDFFGPGMPVFLEPVDSDYTLVSLSASF